MTKLTGHFDGRVIVPDAPVSLPKNEQLVIHVAPAKKASSLADMLNLSQQLDFSNEDLLEMSKAIDDGCERIDPNEW